MFMLLLSLISFSNNIYTPKNNIVVAIIDTGLNLKDQRFQDVLCKEGHKDFSGEGISDVAGHGTHVAGLIVKHAPKYGFCLVIIKYYKKNQNNLPNLIKSMRYADFIGADIVNISGGGYGYYKEEYNIIKNNKALWVVAAGNEGTNLNLDCNYYPACYNNLSNIIVVGCSDSNRCNYGNIVKYKEKSIKVMSTCIKGNCPLTGSSMSTAIRTGKLVYEMVK